MEWFDLGGAGAETAPGIARFKLGFGGEMLTTTETYL
jgi:hypothetical protein